MACVRACMCHSAHVEVIESIWEPILSSVLLRQGCFCFCCSVNSRLARLQVSGWFLYLLSYHRSFGITDVHQLELQMCTSWDYRCVPAGITEVRHLGLQMCTRWNYRCALAGMCTSTFAFWKWTLGIQLGCLDCTAFTWQDVSQLWSSVPSKHSKTLKESCLPNCSWEIKRCPKDSL